MCVRIQLRMFKIMTLANLSHQSQGGRLSISERRRNHNPETHNPENHNPETEHNRGPNNPAAQAGVGVRRWPRIGDAGWKMGVDVGPRMGVRRDKNRCRWGHLAPEKRTEEQLQGEVSARGTLQNISKNMNLTLILKKKSDVDKDHEDGN